MYKKQVRLFKLGYIMNGNENKLDNEKQTAYIQHK